MSYRVSLCDLDGNVISDVTQHVTSLKIDLERPIPGVLLLTELEQATMEELDEARKSEL